MLTIKELETYLAKYSNNAKFDYDAYIEMHGGPHDMGLHSEKGTEGNPYDTYIPWVCIPSSFYGDIYYGFIISADGTSREDNKRRKYEVLDLVIKKRSDKKRSFKHKYSSHTNKDYYYISETLFKGKVENLEDLKKLFKQLGIEG